MRLYPAKYVRRLFPDKSYWVLWNIQNKFMTKDVHYVQRKWGKRYRNLYTDEGLSYLGECFKPKRRCKCCKNIVNVTIPSEEKEKFFICDKCYLYIKAAKEPQNGITTAIENDPPRS